LQGASQKKKNYREKNKTRPHYRGINLFTQKTMNTQEDVIRCFVALYIKHIVIKYDNEKKK
jgi:hypothetical protein